MAAYVSSLLVFLTLITEAVAWRCAYYKNLFDQQPEYKECLVGCCGDSNNRHCCSPIGLIVGCCVAGSFVIIVGIIIACCIKKRKQREADAYFRARYPHANMSMVQGYRPPGADKY